MTIIKTTETNDPVQSKREFSCLFEKRKSVEAFSFESSLLKFLFGLPLFTVRLVVVVLLVTQLVKTKRAGKGNGVWKATE